MGLNLSLEELEAVKAYFTKEGRLPTDVELQSIAQAWSEHCCYKSSKCFLREHIFGIKHPDVLSKGDAGVMNFDDEHAYALRIESHNHPSAIEPYGGAATGIGGIVRDVLAMGAQPIALVDPLFFGPLELREVPAGVKLPKYLIGGVVGGIRDYGNRIGIPTVAGGVFFDPSYTGNCLVNVGCIGFLRKDKLLNNAVQGTGDVLILVGGRTGRDGIHGVTFASAELSSKSEDESRGAVQLGDPIMDQPADRLGSEDPEDGREGGVDRGGVPAGVEEDPLQARWRVLHLGRKTERKGEQVIGAARPPLFNVLVFSQLPMYREFAILSLYIAAVSGVLVGSNLKTV